MTSEPHILKNDYSTSIQTGFEQDDDDDDDDDILTYWREFQNRYIVFPAMWVGNFKMVEPKENVKTEMKNLTCPVVFLL